MSREEGTESEEKRGRREDQGIPSGRNRVERRGVERSMYSGKREEGTGGFLQ